MSNHQVVTFGVSTKIRAIGIADETPNDTKFFNGFHVVGFVLKPKWSRAGTDGQFANTVLFFSQEDADRSMDDLKAWYDSEGVRHGDREPEGLAIICLNP